MSVSAIAYADEVPLEYQGKMLHNGCKEDINVCRGYMLRLAFSYSTRAEAYDEGFIAGAMWHMINSEKEPSLFNEVSSEAYRKKRDFVLDEALSCMSDNALLLSDKFIAWGNKNPDSLGEYHAFVIKKFLEESYSCQ